MSYKRLEYKIFDELSYERMGGIRDLGRQIDFNNLTYDFKSKDSRPINVIGFKAPLHYLIAIQK